MTFGEFRGLERNNGDYVAVFAGAAEGDTKVLSEQEVRTQLNQHWDNGTFKTFEGQQLWAAKIDFSRALD